MKQKQRQKYMGTIQALKEHVGPEQIDPSQIGELNQKLQEMNEKNEKLKNEIQHSTTKEDEIELLMMTENEDMFLLIKIMLKKKIKLLKNK